jgi:hypothetical protein
MAKIDRATQKIFGDDVVAQDNHCQFGSLKAGTVVYSKDPFVIQGLAAWGTGWKGATVNNQAPVLQDLNAFSYLMSRQLAYLFQSGVSEYDSGTTYYQNSYCASGGALYISKTDNNLGNALTNSAHWKLVIKPATGGEVFGHAPVGSIMAWQGGYFTGGSNGGFTNVLGNTVALANAYLNPFGYYVCDGSQLNDPDSPIFSAAGRFLPNLSDSRFLMGSTSAGVAGGSNSVAHTHSVTSNVSLSAHGITQPTFSTPGHFHDMSGAGSTLSTTNSGAHEHNTGSTTVSGGSPHQVFNIAGSGYLVASTASAHTHSMTGRIGKVSGGSDGNSDIGCTRTTDVAVAAHTVSNPAVTSGAASDTENRPLHLTTLFIMRIK